MHHFKVYLVLINRVLILTLLFVAYSYSQTTSTTPATTIEYDLNMDVNLDGDTTDTVYLISNLNELLWIQEQIENNPSENWSKGKIFLQTAHFAL